MWCAKSFCCKLGARGGSSFGKRIVGSERKRDAGERRRAGAEKNTVVECSSMIVLNMYILFTSVYYDTRVLYGMIQYGLFEHMSTTHRQEDPGAPT